MRRFLHFPAMPLTDEFVTADQRGTEFLADIDVHFCAGCGVAQTLQDVDVAEYYRSYRYSASSSGLVRRFMQRLAEESVGRFGLRPGDRVIDIGSGDGYQLSCFGRLGARVLGFEPSAELAKASRSAGVDVQQCLFSGETVDEIPAEFRRVQLILLTYTFDHLPEPMTFLNAVRPLLDPQRGVLLIEVHDLEKILDRCETCLFEHEHTIYLHRLSIQRLLERAGFVMLTAELLPEGERRGNSLLVAAALPSAVHTVDDSVRAGLPAHLEHWEAYSAFAQKVEQAYARLRHHVRLVGERGGRVAGYGAGGRGVMTLAMAGFSERDIAFLCDQNSGFHGRYTPATHIRVVPPERLMDEAVDEVIVFSYGYQAEIRERWKAYEARGGRFVSLLDVLK